MKAKVKEIIYRVNFDGKEFSQSWEAIAHVYRHMAEEAGKTGWLTWARVSKIAKIDPIQKEGFFGEVISEVELEYVAIQAPAGIQIDPHIPNEIEVDIDEQ